MPFGLPNLRKRLRRSSTNVALDSHNPTSVNIYGNNQTIKLGLSSGAVKELSIECLETDEVEEIPQATTIGKDLSPNEGPPEMQQPRTVRSGNSPSGMGSIDEEEESPITPKHPRPQAHHTRQNSFKTMRGSRILSNEGISNSLLSRPTGIQSVEPSTPFSTTSFTDYTYKLPRLELKNLDFVERRVEEHVRTYMTSKRPNFTPNTDYTISLWHPFTSINLDEEVQEQHCIPGDVGTFNSRGGFDVMFNIFMTLEQNRRMGYGPPIAFVPVEFSSDTIVVETIAKDDYDVYITDDIEPFNEGQRPGTYSFRCIRPPKRPGSAILVAPKCSMSGIHFQALPTLRTYLTANVKSWYRRESYPNKQHQDLSDRQLKLIHTCHKTNFWAAAALPSSSVKKGPGGLLNATYSKRRVKDKDTYVWDAPSFMTNHGSSRPNVKKINYTVAVEVWELGIPSNTVGGSIRSSFQRMFSRTTFK